MIGFIQGKILSLQPEASNCVLLAQDVGYELHASKKTLEALAPNQQISFFIHTHVREDALTLFAFLTETEKLFFRVLINVQGLGPKTALALLSEHGAEKLTQLILNKDAKEISSAPGVGKKLAERLILELGSKLEKMAWIGHLKKMSSSSASIPPSPQRQLREDLTSALLHLGYASHQIKNKLDQLFDRADAEKDGFEFLLKTVLKEMSCHG